MDELPKRLVDMLSEARSAHDPQPDDAHRVAAALKAAIPGFQPLEPTVPVRAAVHTAPQAMVGAAAASKWLGVLLLVGAAAMVAIRSPSEHVVAVQSKVSAPTALAGTQAPTTVEVQSRISAPTALAGAQAPTIIEHPRPSLEPIGPVTTARRPGRSPARTIRSTRVQPAAPAAIAAPSAAPTATELPLIQQAARALRDHQLAYAQQLLERHAVLFPEGALKLERIGMLVVTLCEQGKVSEARPLRARLLAEAPDNLLADRIATSCDRK